MQDMTVHTVPVYICKILGVWLFVLKMIQILEYLKCTKYIKNPKSYFMWLQVESALKPLLDAYFSPLSGVQVLAQPGNFYVASAFCLAVSIIGKKMTNHHWDNLAQGYFFDFMFFIVR